MVQIHEHKNRFWWMITAVILLFVAASAMPVAALEWPSNNNTFMIPANGIRTYGGDFSYNGNGSYWFMMLNGSQGMNAIHITDDPQSPYGGVYNSKPTSGTLYVSSTGGHTGEDNALLLISINSTNATDINNFAIDLAVSGYNWAPLTGATAPTWTDSETYDAAYYNSSALADSFDAGDYMETSTGNDAAQKWKFAPLNNYPVFGGQDMATDQKFKMILVDLNVGAISTSFGHAADLQNRGTARVDYEITSHPSSAAKIAFNTYIFNADAPQGKHTVHWINALNVSGQTGSSYSGWTVTP